MTLYDTHVHFDDLLARTDLQSVLAEADEVRVMIAIGGSPEANAQAASLALSYPGRIKASAAYGRQMTGDEHDTSSLEILLNKHRFSAIGETGLDFHHDLETSDAQIVLFQQMLDLACAHRLPVIVHSRETEDITITMLAEYVKRWNGESSLPGVLHCFTGSRAFAAKLLDMGFLISFSGILTFKNAGDLRSVAAMIPEDRLLIETDSPYLTPEPHRGKTNTPAMVRYVAEALAAIRNTSLEEIALITSRNAKRLFI